MKRILICLSLEPFDEHLIHYVSKIPGLFTNAQLHLIHVIPNYQHSYAGKELASRLDVDEDGFDADDLRNHAIKVGLKGAETSIAAVLKGSPSTEILKYMHAWDIDLVFLGKRDHDQGSGYLVAQLASRSPASMWLVPELENPHFRKVLLATDFSEPSGVAYDCLKRLIACIDEIAELTVLSAYDVPAGYFKAGLTYDQMSDQMRAVTENGLSDWLSKQPALSLSITPTVVEEERGTAATIIDTAEKSDVDLLMLGSRGRSGLSAFLLGSTTDRIIRTRHKFPVFIARSHDDSSKRLLKEMFRVE
jgi:nucleotide-binding universal stress UspA family protein